MEDRILPRYTKMYAGRSGCLLADKRLDPFHSISSWIGRSRLMTATVVLALAVLTSVMINPLLPASAATWSSPTAITNDSILHFSPSIIQDNQGTVYLFWDQNPGIYYFITNTNNNANGIWPRHTQYSMNSL